MSRNHSNNLLGLLLSIIVLFIIGCSQRKADEMIPIGPDVKADLVIFFKTGTSSEDIYKFATETISIPEEKGYRHLPGIWQVLYILPIDGHEGYAVTFFPEATEAQRELVKSRVETSPIVYKVMENVAPKDIQKVG